MTGYLISPLAEQTALAPLISWRICLTDGSPCDSFSVRFCYDRAWLPVLQQAVRFRAEEGGKTVFFGVVDDFEITLGKNGLLCEVTGRSMAALLMDNQVRATEFVTAQLADILKNYVTPYGVTAVRADAMRPLSQFVVETGDTCWQVLCGFCRHSADIFPRFSADGTLLLTKSSAAKEIVLSQPIVSCSYAQTRYGVLCRQVVLSQGTASTAENAAFRALGGNCTHYCNKTGKKLRATWRDGAQRIADSRADFRVIRVALVGGFLAQPKDRVRLNVPLVGILGSFTVRSAQTQADENGVLCTLTLEGA